ncbi:MAG: hypothetical protein U0X73_04035 [Thermoanaerobaculia bacterium]
MRAPEVKRLFDRYLAEDLQGFGVARGLIFAKPVELLLRGFCLESSRKTDFYFWVFVQPLYVPKYHVTVSYGERLGGASGRAWAPLGEREFPEMMELRTAIRDTGRSFLDRCRGPEDFARLWGSKASAGAEHDTNIIEATAYSHILTQQFHLAVQELDLLETRIGSTGSPTDWALRSLQRARSIRELLGSDPSAAIDRLLVWRAETLQALGLAAHGASLSAEVVMRPGC